MIMKKYFIFAAIATAGLFASCSSDDNITANEGQPLEDQDGRPAIQIGVGSLKSTVATRGTGSAGSTVAEGANIWRGERVHVLMYKVDEANKIPTFDYTLEDNTSAKLYDDAALLVTPLKAEQLEAGIAKEPTDPTVIGDQATFKVKYYPVYGQSDFWGYYLGGYGMTDNDPDKAAGAGTVSGYKYTAPEAPATNPSLTAETDLDNADVMATDFVIDGTHDLLVGNAPWSLGQTGADAFRYSAKAARQGIQPNITFKHLLSRLKFKAVAGNAKAHGVRVNAIKVRSKKTGKMIVAYKYTTDGTTPVTEPIRIAWDGTEEALDYNDAALTQLELKKRASLADDTYASEAYASATHDGLLVAENLNIIYKFSGDTYKKVVVDGTHYMWETVTVDDSNIGVAYDNTTHDALLDQANVNKIYAFSDAVKKVVFNDPNYQWEDVTVDDSKKNEASTANDALLVVGNLNTIYQFTDGFKKVVADPDTYYAWAASTSTEYDAADADEKMVALTPVAMQWASTGSPANYTATVEYTEPVSFTTVANATELEAARIVLNVDGDYYFYETDNKTYYKVTVASNTPGTAEEEYVVPNDCQNAASVSAANELEAAKTVAGTTVYYIANTKTYRKYVINTPATGAAGVAKEIGEALLVAPQAKYEIEVDYEMDRYTAQNWYANATGNPVDNTPGDYVASNDIITGQLITDLVRTATEGTPATPKAFEAGSSYLITITLYGPEQIVITTTLTAWEQGDQDIEIGKD